MLPVTHVRNVRDDVIYRKARSPNLNSINIFFTLSLGPNRQIQRLPIFPAIRYSSILAKKKAISLCVCVYCSAFSSPPCKFSL